MSAPAVPDLGGEIVLLCLCSARASLIFHVFCMKTEFKRESLTEYKYPE